MIDEFRACQLRALCAAMSFLAALVSPAAALGDDGGSSSGGSSSGCIDWAPGISGWTSSSGGSSSSGSSSGISSGSSGSSGFPDTQPPSAPGGVVVSAITSSTAKIAWTASTDDFGVVEYSVYASPAGDPETESVKFANGCTHEVTITGLIPRTDYTFVVEAVDVAGNRTRSAPASATTADPAPFSLSVVPSTVSVTCGVDARATVQVSASAGFTDVVHLTIRDPGWGVTARFDPVTTANTSTLTFSCEPPASGWFGAMLLVEVVGSYGAQEATAQITLYVSSSDASSSGGSPGSSSGAGSSSSSSGSSGGRAWWRDGSASTGERPEDPSEFCIDWAPGRSGWASSSGGSSSSSGSGSSSGSSSGWSGFPDDTQPPSAPGGVVVSAITSSTARIAWTASSDDIGVGCYLVWASPAGGPEPESADFADGCTHETTIRGLIPRTDYTFVVEAVDVVGNHTRSVPATATTADPPPFSLSVVPSNVSVTCGVDAKATVQIIPSEGFTGMVDLAIRDPGWGVAARFDPATTANTSTITFSCESTVTYGPMHPVEVVGSYGAWEATAQLTFTVFGSGYPPGVSSSGGSSGSESSSGSGLSSSGSGGHGSGLPLVGCASGGSSEPGLLTLLPLLLTAVVLRRRGASRPVA